jgi:predicted 3-demethylubiquinone-9 3-methyltransferase (glyoxalase superfamily)
MAGMTPCLWFDDQAEEAARFYVSVFKNATMGVITRYGAAESKVAGKPEGSVLTVAFQLDGQDFVALNGGPQFSFTPAISFMVNCQTQTEIDHLWDKLSEGGEPGPCGWLQDQYGVSWQIVPASLDAMVQDPDVERSQRVMQAMLQMKKLDIAALTEAYNRR